MEVTFLREEDIWGDRALEVIQAYGTAVGISDVAIALGTCMGSGTKNSAGVASGVAWSASSDWDRPRRQLGRRPELQLP